MQGAREKQYVRELCWHISSRQLFVLLLFVEETKMLRISRERVHAAMMIRGKTTMSAISQQYSDEAQASKKTTE